MFRTEHGTPCYHEPQSIYLIKEVVSRFKPEVVIELGTKNGGFTEVLQSCTDDNTDIYTYDSVKLRNSSTFRDNVYFIICDVLSEPVKSITGLCSMNKRVLLYCDNGNKIKEFELYTKYLKKGDLLGVHDWQTEIFPSSVEKYLKGFTFIRRKEFKDLGSKTRFWKRG